jgi:hypothetical protein
MRHVDPAASFQFPVPDRRHHGCDGTPAPLWRLAAPVFRTGGDCCAGAAPDKTWLESHYGGPPRKSQGGGRSFPTVLRKTSWNSPAYRDDTQRDARIEKPFNSPIRADAASTKPHGSESHRFSERNLWISFSTSAIVGRGGAGTLQCVSAHRHKNLRPAAEEAAWECACRAGTASAIGDGSNLKDRKQWIRPPPSPFCGRPLRHHLRAWGA